MVERDFEPKLGRTRGTPNRKAQRYLSRVVRDVRKATQGRSTSRASGFTGNRSGRGLAAAFAPGLGRFQPGRRRVIVKARFTRLRNGSVGTAHAHLRYVQRDGVTREGEPGQLYNADRDQTDGKQFLEGSEGDRHQFRFIVAPEDSAALEDLKPFTRDLMRQMEVDLGTRLEWVAVDHFNTGHPHTHVIVRGKDDQGKDLIIARDYLSHSMRERARDLMTLELGPEIRPELDRKLENEMHAERLTRIDGAIIRDAAQGVLVMPTSPGTDQQFQSLRMGRLRKLQSMGLADELQPGVWLIAERTENVLRQLGARGDIIKTMQRALRSAGLEKSTADFVIFGRATSPARVTGKLVALGLSDELNDRHFALVDGMDGKLHYAEIGKLNSHDPPQAGMIVSLVGAGTPEGTHKRNRDARLFIESHVPLDKLPNSEGASWLDRKILATSRAVLAQKGFGIQVERALVARQKWLVSEGLLEEKNGKLVARRNLLATLRRRELLAAAGAVEKETGLRHRPELSGNSPKGKLRRALNLASGRYAVLVDGKAFSLVPWARLRTRSAGLGVGGNRKIARGGPVI